MEDEETSAFRINIDKQFKVENEITGDSKT